MRQIRFGILLLAAIVLLTACGPDAPDIDVDSISTSIVQTVYASLTETASVRPTDTPAPTVTPQPTITPYWTATPGPDFSAAHLVSASVDYNGRTLIVIEIPGLSADATTAFRGAVSGVEYSCVRQADHPDNLFCFGPIRGPYITADFLLFAGAGAQPIFQVPFFVEPTQVMGLPRYENNSLCEVEPLYQPSRPELLWAQDPAKAGCYAITCYADSGKTTYKCGTTDSCLNWPANPCP